MGKKVTFILGIHNHQPVGNFDHIFDEAYAKAYRPFLEVMSDYPKISFALHNSGVLWDWLAKRHPEYIDLVGEMTARGQVEIMSGGYYEPILTIIPERDRRGQLAKMENFVIRRFGMRPRGCWLTERIWDPHLPRTLSDANLEYVIVDDAHFKSTGFSSEEMRGFFLTEEDGVFINVYPIDKKLRYMIPFRDPEEVISYLGEVAEEEGLKNGITVLADDGEKFGLWTGTHSLCYERKWLRRFCDLLMENKDWLEVSTFSGAIDDFPPIGIVYLPTASYSEMMEWALPLRARERYREAETVLRSSDKFDEPADLVRGGFWRNFLVKYEESNWMHKRMLVVSNLVEEYRKAEGGDDKWEMAREHLYQAQCNCAYWHGLFGGLYLPHLRSAVYSHLVKAESIIEEKKCSGKAYLELNRGDFDGDGVREVILSNRSMKAILKLRGGALRELDIRRPAFNLTDTLTRREEIYHKKLAMLSSEAGRKINGAVSIHDVVSSKERDLDKHLVYDFYPRASLLDHFITEEVDLESFSRAEYRERGDFLHGEYELVCDGFEGSEECCCVIFKRSGDVDLPSGKVGAVVSKSVCLYGGEPDLEVHYKIISKRGRLKCRFAVESVFTLLAGNAPDRFFRFTDRKVRDVRLASMGGEKDVSSFSMVDEWLNMDVGFSLKPVALLWRFPVETVSNSESGFERVYQGSAVVPVWPIDLRVGETAEFSIEINIRPAVKGGGKTS